MTTRDWYAAHETDHAHCQENCWHPQPFIGARAETPAVEELFCGRCWVVDGRLSVMIPCTPETCAE